MLIHAGRSCATVTLPTSARTTLHKKKKHYNFGQIKAKTEIALLGCVRTCHVWFD